MSKFDAITKTEEDANKNRARRTQNKDLPTDGVMTKEQLYDMFQQILGVKKFEHQIIFNALQVPLAVTGH